MPDGSHEARVPLLSAEALDEAERRALIAAAAEARADLQPVDLVEVLAALRDERPPPGTDE